MPTREPHLLRSMSHREPEAALSMDRRWLAYVSDESGRQEVYVERFQTEPPSRQQRWQASSNGGRFPHWRPDNQELFYVASDGELMSVTIKASSESLDLGSPRALFSLPAVFNGSYTYDVAPDGQRFLVSAVSTRRGHEPLSVIVNWPAALIRSQSLNYPNWKPKSPIGPPTINFAFDKDLLCHGMLADGTTCRLSQHEFIRPLLAGFFGKKPIERNLSIVRMTVLAGFDLLFGLQS
jgi:hypothetical protein